MTRLLLILVILFTSSLTSLADNHAKAKPNFVLIFIDDMGYGDIGPFGAKQHRTPHLDRMAAEGIKLTSFYSTAGVCTPSRSSLMTGCYPQRVNMQRDTYGGWVLFPIARKGLHPNEITIADLLKTQGYATGMVGKWHLGDQPQFLPTRQGFDSYFGIPYSNDMGFSNRGRNYPALPLMRGPRLIEDEPDQKTITRRYTIEAVRFIHENKDQPFFLYMPHTMPHNPIFASDDFRGKSANGIYGDSIEEIDWSVGQVLGALKEAGVDDNTLVVFTSDNGAASNWGGSNAPLSGFKGSTMEGGMREPFVARFPGKIPAGATHDAVTSTLDILPTFAHLAGTTAPTDRIIDGKNIWPILTDQPGAKSPRQAYYYYHLDQLQAIRSGPWKLHVELNADVRGRNKNYHRAAALYNLDADIGEKDNVHDKHPEVVARLMKFAAAAREDLGDLGRKGKNTRPAGHIENAVPLTNHMKDPTKPHYRTK
jgi:arylsulfatase A-like enzyme